MSTSPEVLLYIVYEDYDDTLEMVEMRAKREPTRYRVMTRRDAIHHHTFVAFDNKAIGLTAAAARLRYIDLKKAERDQLEAKIHEVDRFLIKAMTL